MSTPLQVGITGGIGSGKSTIAAIFSSLGIPVYDADSRAKSIMNTDEILIKQIKNEFGDRAYDGSGHLDRKFLADQVFGFPERLKKLNSLVHPRVFVNYKAWLHTQQSVPYILKEAALLFESGSYKELDKIIWVSSPVELRISRVMKRDRRSKAEIANIISRQWPEERGIELADFVIKNDELSPVIPQVLKLHQNFKAQNE